MTDSPRIPPPGERPGGPSSQGRGLPGTYRAFAAKFPEVAAQHERMARAVDAAGPLDAKTTFLIKIGISLGAGLESALRSHVRRATAAGATEEEIEQAILLGMNTRGFPATVAAWSWAQVQFARDRADGARTDGARTDGARTDGARTDGARTDGARTDGGARGEPDGDE